MDFAAWPLSHTLLAAFLVGKIQRCPQPIADSGIRIVNGDTQ